MIGREENYMKRKVKEARQEKNSMNLDGGLRIHPTWQTVLFSRIIIFFFFFFFKCNRTIGSIGA